MEKKWLLAATLGCATVAGQIHANDYVEWSTNDCFYDECCQEGKVLVAAEFLWWTQGSYFPFANNVYLNPGNLVTSPSAPVPSVTNTQLLPYARISEKWSPGVRVGLGWETASCDWQIWGAWTGYSNYSRKVLVARGPSVPIIRNPIVNFAFTVPPVGAEFTDSSLGGSPTLPFMRGHQTVATHKLNYNVADLTFGRTLEFECGIDLIPFVGVRATFINQQDEAFFTGITQLAPGSVADMFANIGGRTKDNQHVWGVGPRVGLGATWGNWCGFKLIGNISAAILYGRYKEYGSLSEYGVPGGVDVSVFAPNDPPILTINTTTRDRYNQIIPNIQAQLGFAYEIDFSMNGSPYNIEIFAMWEGNGYWGAYNHFFRERMLGLNGLTTGFAFTW